jgi:hypothetical protein
MSAATGASASSRLQPGRSLRTEGLFATVHLVVTARFGVLVRCGYDHPGGAVLRVVGANSL